MKSNGVNNKLSSAVALSGTAKEGSIGPPMGVVEIGISEKAYLCRVSLPGVKKNESDLCFDIKRDGTLNIRGKVAVHDLSDEASGYKIVTQELNPPGQFTIAFTLPGPVDPRLASPNFRPDGILEIVVFKAKENPVQ